MPVTKKQKKGSDAASEEPPSAGGSMRQSSSASRSPGLEMALHQPHGGPSMAMGMPAKPPNMGLKLDMNFMHRAPQQHSAYIDDIGSSHPSAYHYQSHAPSTATSPTTALSMHTPMPRTGTPLTSPHSSLLKVSLSSGVPECIIQAKFLCFFSKAPSAREVPSLSTKVRLPIFLRNRT